MANEGITTDLKSIVADSRLLSIEWKHGFINYDHVFVAMLKNKCAATRFLEDFNLKIWEEKIKGTYPAESTQTILDSVFLTKVLDTTFKHAFIIAKEDKQENIDSVHLLLAILSFENEITQAINKAGILIEDITTAYFKKTIKRFPPILKPLRERSYSRLALLFLSKHKKGKSIAELQHNANDLHLYGQFNDSINVCLAGLGLVPEDVWLKSLLVDNYVKLKNYDAALLLLSELVNEDPKNARLRFSKSYILDTAGKNEEAAAILDQLLQEQPDNKVFLNNRGFNLLRQARYEESIPFFEKAIQQDPLFAYALNNLGFAKYKVGVTNAGTALIDKALELDKGDSFAYKHKGIIAMDLGDNIEAKRYFDLALRYGYLDKHDNEVTFLLAKLAGH